MFNRKITIFLLLATISAFCVARDVADYHVLYVLPPILVPFSMLVIDVFYL